MSIDLFIFLPIYTEAAENKVERKRRDPLSELETCQTLSNKAVTLVLGEGIIIWL